MTKEERESLTETNRRLKQELADLKLKNEEQRLKQQIEFAKAEAKRYGTQKEKPLTEEEKKAKEDEYKKNMDSLENQKILAYVALFFIGLGIPLLIFIVNYVNGDTIGGGVYAAASFVPCCIVAMLVYAGCSYCTASEAELLEKEHKVPDGTSHDLKNHANASAAITAVSIGSAANKIRKIPGEIYNNANKH